MARIYSWREIENNKIPTIENFILAKEILFTGLSDLFERHIILGARIYGSVARGEFSPQSDIDLAVICERRTDDLRNLYNIIYDRTNIRVEANETLRRNAESGLHSNRSFYLEHFSKIPEEGNIIGIDPLSFFAPSHLETGLHALNPFQVLKSYLSGKLQKFSEGFSTLDEHEWLMALQRAFELPANGGRIILIAMEYFTDNNGKFLYKMDSESDGKEDVYRNWRKFSQKKGFEDIELYEDLILGGIVYKTILFNTLKDINKSNVDISYLKSNYIEILETMRNEYLPVAQEWTGKVLQKLENMGIKESREGKNWKNR